METLGYFSAVFVGLTLGLIGGGGSILTVPILVYLFGIESLLASSYSLFVVGFTSALGVIGHYRQGNIRIRNALYFGIPSIIGVMCTRKFLLPLIPQHIISIKEFELNKPGLILVLFALLMITSAYYMIIKKREEDLPFNRGTSRKTLLINGLVIGSLTGFLGAGGGFLIIPTLIYCSMTMREAVGTSLLIMTMSAFLGFLGDIQMKVEIDYSFLLVFSSIAGLGILLGTYLSKYISSEKLKPAFGVFVLITGVYILIRETLLP